MPRITRTNFHELRPALLADELVTALPTSILGGICVGVGLVFGLVAFLNRSGQPENLNPLPWALVGLGTFVFGAFSLVNKTSGSHLP